jgi:hypothetical protein
VQGLNPESPGARGATVTLFSSPEEALLELVPVSFVDRLVV